MSSGEPGPAEDADDQLILTIDQYIAAGNSAHNEQEQDDSGLPTLPVSVSTTVLQHDNSRLHHRSPNYAQNQLLDSDKPGPADVSPNPNVRTDNVAFELSRCCSIKFNDFEHVLSVVGGFGRYHKFVMFWVQLCIMQLCSVTVMMGLSLYQPTVHCKYGLPGSNDTITLLPKSDNISERQRFCQIYDADECREVHFDSPFTSIIEEWALICGRDWVPDFISSTQTLLQYVVCLFTIAADKIGRLKVVKWCFLMLVVFNTSAAFSTHWLWFWLTRLGANALAPACSMVIFVYTVELADAKNVVLMNMSNQWHINYLLLGWLAAQTQHWRWFNALAGAAGIPAVLLMTCCLVESPRWLIQRGRLTEAAAALTFLARRNGRDSGFVIGEENLMQIPNCSRSLGSSGLDWTQLLINRKMCLSALVVAATMFGTEFAASAYTQQVSAFEGPPWMTYIYFGSFRLLIIPLVYYPDKYWAWFGRQQMSRWPLMFIACCYGCLSVVLLRWHTSHWTNSVEFFLMLLSAVVCNFLWVALSQYQAELFPTYLRNSAQAVTSMFNPIAVVVVLQFVYIEKFYRSILAVACFVTVSSVLVLACIFLPETKGKPLPDAAPESAEFEGLKAAITRCGRLGTSVRRRAACQRSLLDGDSDDEQPIGTTPF